MSRAQYGNIVLAPSRRRLRAGRPARQFATLVGRLDSIAEGDRTLLDNSATVATQPINKYYCNLMNAIGVKAGADGFPALGGTAPVTRYGKYDDTTLFGTDAPAVIKNPGEYAALRAG